MRYEGVQPVPLNKSLTYTHKIDATSPDEIDTGSAEQPVSRLVFVWLLMPPLLYLASRGQFWFQDPSSNQALLDLSGVTSDESGGGRTLITGVVYALLALVCFRWIRQGRGISGKGKLFVALALMAIASSTWSQFPAISLKNGIFFATNTVFALLLYRRFTPLQQLRLFYLLGWICLVLSYSLCLFFPRYGFDPMAAVGFGHAWRGMYGYKNACAMTTMFLLPVGIYLPSPKPWQKLGRAAYVVFSFLLIVLSESRTGWVVLAFFVVYVCATMLSARFKASDKPMFILLELLIVVPLLAALYINRDSMTYLIGKDPSLTGRSEIWKAVFISILKRPILGYGYVGFFNGYQGEAANVSLAAGWGVTASHNGYLDVWVTLGAVGLALLLCTFVWAVRDAFVCICREYSPYLAWCASIVFLMIVTNTDEKAMMVPNDLIWVYYVIACVGLADGARRIQGVPKGSRELVYAA